MGNGFRWAALALSLGLPSLATAAPTAVRVEALAGDDPAAAPTLQPAPAPAPAQPEAAALTADTMATAEKPTGFAYSVLRDALVDDLSETLLYVKSTKESHTTTAVPVPKDRAKLAACIAGGKVDDLVRGAVVTVEFDPKGVVKPQIVIQATAQIEVLDGAKVMDRGGSKLFVLTAEGTTRAFEIAGGTAAWDSVVEGGKSADLKPGTPVRIEFDPSGRQPLKVAIKGPPAAPQKPPSKGSCTAARPGAGSHWPTLALTGLLATGWLGLRRRSRER